MYSALFPFLLLFPVLLFMYDDDDGQYVYIHSI